MFCCLRSGSATEIFKEIWLELALELKELVDTCWFPVELELLCEYLAGVAADVMTLTLLLLKCWTCIACACFFPVGLQNKVFLVCLMIILV